MIDPHGRLMAAMDAHKFDIEDFHSAIRVETPSVWLKTSLEGQTDPLFIDVAALISLPVNDELLARLNTFPSIIAFCDKSPDQQKWLQQVMHATDRVIAVHDINMNDENWELLKNQCTFFWRQRVERMRLREQMVRFSQEMDSLIQNAQRDMQRAKKIHEDVVPRRVEEVRGLNLYTKYAVGDGAGSEYFDVLRENQKTHLIFIHTNSYLASSCLMGLLAKHKSGHADRQSFLAEARMEIKGINSHKKVPVQVQLLWMTIDQAGLQCEGQSYGDFQVINQERGVIEIPNGVSFLGEQEGNFDFRLTRGEKLVVFSPGFISNWDSSQKKKRDAFCDEQKKLSPQDLLMELFFQLKTSSSGDFLVKDATAVLMEVQRHAIQSV